MAHTLWEQALETHRNPSHKASVQPLQLSIQPLQTGDIDRIHEIEKTAYAYPWSRKHFADSLTAGHGVVALVAQAGRVAQPGQDSKAGKDESHDPEAPQVPQGPHWMHAPTLSNGAYVLSYCVAMVGVQELHLLNITTPPAHRRQGWARLLLNTLAHWGRLQGAENLWLEVRRSNAGAQALYTAMGFEAVGVRKGYYPDAAGQREDAIVMRLALLH
jgi:[ribosomal protein S18]-alanine N-acetyltransferase